MNVLITGGAGYIGSHCNKFFNQQGISTIVLDNLRFGHPEAIHAGEIIHGDVADQELLESIFSTRSIDAVTHFAALADVADSVKNPASYYANNVTAMIGLLDAMIKHSVKYFIFSSSASTFGEPIYVPIDEKHPLQPINPYGETKLMGEKMLHDYGEAYGVKHVSFRYFNAAGADGDGEIGESHDPEHHLLPNLFQKALGKKKDFFVFGQDYPTPDGTCIRDYVHVTDLADAHYRGLQYLLNGGVSEQFNLGNNRGYSIREVIKTFEAISGIAVQAKDAPRRQGDPAQLIASNENARNILGWTPKHSDLANIIQTAWKWEQIRPY